MRVFFFVSVPSASLLMIPKMICAIDKVDRRDLDTLKKSVPKNLMRFDKAMCTVLLLDQGSPRYERRLERNSLRAALLKRTWES